MKNGLIVAVLVIACSSAAFAVPTIYTGSLSTCDGGLQARGVWENGVCLSWSGGEQQGISYITYRMCVNTPKGMADISHADFGVSESFGPPNLLDWKVTEGFATEVEVGNWEDFRAIKLDGVVGNYFEVTFISDRKLIMTPNFYAKDGKAGGEWNEVWIAPDHWMLGFDTETSTVPVPSAAVLAGIGLLFVRKRVV